MINDYEPSPRNSKSIVFQHSEPYKIHQPIVIQSYTQSPKSLPVKPTVTDHFLDYMSASVGAIKGAVNYLSQ